MKELLVNNIGKRLIEEKGFFLFNTPSFPACIIENSFFKEKWGALHVINFINSDVLDLNNFHLYNQIAHNEMEALKKASSANALLYFKVFVSENGFDDGSFNKLMMLYEHSMQSKTYFIPVLIDIKNSIVQMPDKEKIDKIGVYDIIKNLLDDKDNLNSMYDLEQIERDIKNEYGYKELERFESMSKPYATYSFIGINILIFIITSIFGGMNNFYVLVLFGAKVNSLILRGQYWRLIASAFLHAGILHIAFNMYGLYNLGPIVEGIYGSRKFLFVYLISALSGSIASFTFSNAPSVGASGAIFGLFGALLYLGQKKPKIFSTSFGINILIVLALNIAFGFSNSGIDNFAHLGGLFGGYLAANVTGLKTEKYLNAKKIAAFLLTAALLISIFFIGISSYR